MSFESLGLRPEILRAIEDQGYIEPTPIQLQAIPEIMNGHDIMGGSQTGTGKTAGFTLPILQRLMDSQKPAGKRVPRALILTPTRELAMQVSESVKIYGKYLPLRSTVVFGGISIVPQTEKLERGVDILVATPGRLLDHVEQKNVSLSAVQILVLDEADRMLDMGFIPDIRRILRLLPRERQNLLFSATLPPEIQMLAGDFLRQPVIVQVARHNTAAEGVNQTAFPVDRSRKRALLVHLIKEGNWRQVLVFVNMKVDASSLTKQLTREGIDAAEIHGDRTQAKRTQVLEAFKQGTIPVLVATDVASRGLDIDQLPHVVNFELPQVPEDYIHRIGRTGRAGNAGEAVSLVSPAEEGLLRNIELLLDREIPRVDVPGFELDQRVSRRVVHTKTRLPAPAGSIAVDGESNAHKHWSRHATPDQDPDNKHSSR